MEKRGKASKVKVVRVSFRSSVEIKPYQHAHVELTADVLPGQTVAQVLDDLKLQVAAELRRAKTGEVPTEKSGRFQV